MLRRKMVEPGGPASAATLTVATASFGHIGEFKPDNERFSVYVERFELFLAANGVQDSRKVPLFLTMVGGTTYGLLHHLVAPSNPKDMSYGDIVSKLRAHFEPKPLIIAKRFLFHRRDQKPGESIAESSRTTSPSVGLCFSGRSVDGGSPRQTSLRYAQ